MKYKKLKCETEGKSIDVFIAIFIAAGILVSYLPQHFKIIINKTSEGISPWFLLLGSISMTCSFFNILILQAYEFECCKHESARLCFENTLGIVQLTLQWTMFTMILTLFMVYYPEYRKYVNLTPKEYSAEWRISRLVSASFVFHFFFTLIVSAGLVIFVGGAEKMATRYWADLLGLISLVLASIQYLPQIWATWKRKSVGALSIPMMMMQTPGSFLFVYSLASRTGTRWSTWFVFLITGCLQGTLLIMCICWHFRGKRLGYVPDELVATDDPNERTTLLPRSNIREDVFII